MTTILQIGQLKGFWASSRQPHLLVTEGVVWLTQGRSEDTILAAGERILLSPGSQVVVESLSAHAAFELESAMAQRFEISPRESKPMKRPNCA